MIEKKYAQERILQAAKYMLNKGLIIGSLGNISMRIDKHIMLITPSGRNYTDLNPDELVTVNLETSIYEGKIKPSSEYRLHAAIYNARSEINAIAHTHQPYASTLAAAHRELPPFLDDMVQFIGPSVRLAPYSQSGSNAMTFNAIKALENRFAVLLANHGAICIGRDIDEALLVSEVLEKGSKIFIEAELIGGIKMIEKPEALKIRQNYLEKYSRLKDENR